MNRILKRPMFRIGGSAGTGITSGLDRQGYSEGTQRPGGGPNMLNVAGRSLPSNAPTNMSSRDNIRDKILRDQSIFNEFFKRSTSPIGAGTIPGFLTGLGINLVSATPRGKGLTGLLATAGEAAKEPFSQFQKSVTSRNIAEDKINQAIIAGAISDEDKRQIAQDKFLRELQLKGSEKVRTLTEPELKELGLAKGTIAQIKSDGSINIVSKISDKILEKRGDTKNTIGLLNKIEANYISAGKPVGPFFNLDPDRLAGVVGQFTGSEQGKKLAELEADIKKTTVFLTKAISGAQVSDKEREFIMQLIPQISDTEVQFERKLKSLRSYLADAVENYGGDVEALMSAGVSAKNYLSSDEKNLEDLSDQELQDLRDKLKQDQSSLKRG